MRLNKQPRETDEEFIARQRRAWTLGRQQRLQSAAIIKLAPELGWRERSALIAENATILPFGREYAIRARFQEAFAQARLKNKTTYHERHGLTAREEYGRRLAGFCE